MKKTISLLGLSIFLLFNLNIVLKAQSIEDSLLIHYSWDSTIFDQSGNGYDPIGFRATFVEDRFGNPKSAVYFDGVDDYIVFPSIDELRPPFPLSFSFWFKLDDLIMEHSALFTNDLSEEAHSGVWMNLNSSDHGLRLSYGNGWAFGPESRRTFSTHRSIAENNWYFVVGIIENEESIKIYVNGKEFTGYYEGQAYNMAYIGLNGNIARKDASYYNDPYYFKGYMDEFRYWNRVISDEEVNFLFNGEIVSIGDISGSNIIIYPNPTNDFIHIVANSSDIYSIKIFDQAGKIVFTDNNSKIIDLSNFQNGLYFINIENSDGKKFFQKVIK